MKKIRVVLFGWGLFLIFAPAVPAQNRDLIEIAKKEGNVVAYGSLESGIVDEIGRAFQKKTGIKTAYWRASATKVLDRALSEFRAGQPSFDVMISNDDVMYIMQREGIFSRYDSPSFKTFPPEALHPELGPSYRYVVYGIVYNTHIIKPENAPKSLEDLLRPQYRGKLVMPDPTQHTTTTQWLASLHKIMGKERADRYIRELAATKPVLVESFLPAAERVTTGETPLAITLIRYVITFGQKGAPLEYVRLGKFLGTGQYLGLSKKAPHPNGGKAFIDFFLGDESLGIQTKLGEFVNRKGFYPPLPDAEKVQFVAMVDLDQKAYAEKKKEYRKIFLE